MTDPSRDYFEIHHSINSAARSFCTRHDQAQYTGKAQQLKDAIHQATGQTAIINGNG